MEEFPKARIKPIFGKLSGSDGDVSLEIMLESFELNTKDYSELLESSIRFDGIKISNTPEKIEGKTFNFPVNPDTGFIDGSIYFFTSHNPVDVSKIEFGKINGNKLPLKLFTNWVLEFEHTGFKNFEALIETHILL